MYYIHNSRSSGRAKFRYVLSRGTSLPVFQRRDLHEGADQGGRPPRRIRRQGRNRPKAPEQLRQILVEAEGGLLRPGYRRQLRNTGEATKRRQSLFQVSIYIL